MTRHTIITYLAAAGNIGLWIMSGIESEGGNIFPEIRTAIITASALCLGIAMAFGLVEIASKTSSMPTEFERVKKGVTVTKPNRRYQVGLYVLYGIIIGESFLLMPVVVTLATSTPLASNLPGAWLWVWSFGRVAMAAALLAGLAAVMEPAQRGSTTPQVKPQAKVDAPAEDRKAQDEKRKSADAPQKKYVCDKCGEVLKTASAKAHHVRWKKCKKGAL